MEKEQNSQPQEQESATMYYIIGAVVLVAVVAGVYFMRPKAAPAPAAGGEQAQQQQAAAPVPQPTRGPITKLACDNIYYNPVIGFPRYYVSVEGGDVSGTTKVDCAYSFKVNNQQVASANVSSPLTDAPERGGMTFRCSPQAIELQPQVPTVVDITLTDDKGASATCAATFLFPRP